MSRRPDPAPIAQAVMTACGTPSSDSPLSLVARGFAIATLRAIAHEVDWEAGDPKFLVLDIADTLEGPCYDSTAFDGSS